MSSDKSRRRWTAQEKLAVVAEGRREGDSVSAACRRHSIAPTMYYEWERKAREGSLSGPSPGPRRVRQAAPSVAELQAEIHRLREVIAEIAAENVEMKKGGWP